MSRTIRIAVTLFLMAAGLAVQAVADAKEEKGMVWRFEKSAPGTLPPGWRAAATNAKGRPLWRVVKEPSAPSASQVLEMTRPVRSARGVFGYGSVFNLCWTDRVRMENGTLEVAFRALSGEEDQGGGIAWRIADARNYYVARYNPLEKNLRVYYLRDGRRVMLAGVHVALPKGWHRMKIVQRGDRYEVYLDGKRMLAGEDRTHTRAGGVGLWTKADAVTQFDDFEVVRW